MSKKISGNILESIGETPLIRINRLTSDESAEILVKAEFLNPAGSVKDRVALAMIEDAEKRGLIKPDTTIIEPTSGNTGIGLALVCAVKGYRCTLVMPDDMSLERLYTLHSYGVETVLTPSKKGMRGAIERCEELSKKLKNTFMPHQFENGANAKYHREFTAKEIWSQTSGQIDAFVAGVGTGGTITGVGTYLKEMNPQIKIHAVEPETSAVISGKKAGFHRIQGIGAGFISDILDLSVIDSVFAVSDKDAYKTAVNLSKSEALFCGISSGAALFAALEVAKDLGAGKRVVTVLPDTGARYFSISQYYNF